MATELIPNRIQPSVSAAAEQVAVETQLFELAQRKAQIYSKSSLVPKEYHNNIGNVLIAENMARRMGADTLMVMQNLYVVHGRPGWSAQFLIATFNSCGRFSAIKYRFVGQAGTDSWGCIAYATELATGETIDGTCITIAIAKKEGWAGKNGSKWATIPEQMLRYRAATFLIRATAPEIGMGLLTKEELDDMPIEPVSHSNGRTISRLEDLTDRIAPPVEEPEPVPQVDVMAAIHEAQTISAVKDAVAKFSIENGSDEDAIDAAMRAGDERIEEIKASRGERSNATA